MPLQQTENWAEIYLRIVLLSKAGKELGQNPIDQTPSFLIWWVDHAFHAALGIFNWGDTVNSGAGSGIDKQDPVAGTTQRVEGNNLV